MDWAHLCQKERIWNYFSKAIQRSKGKLKEDVIFKIKTKTRKTKAIFFLGKGKKNWQAFL
jgi:hypothetical protein